MAFTVAWWIENGGLRLKRWGYCFLINGGSGKNEKLQSALRPSNSSMTDALATPGYL